MIFTYSTVSDMLYRAGQDLGEQMATKSAYRDHKNNDVSECLTVVTVLGYTLPFPPVRCSWCLPSQAGRKHHSIHRQHVILHVRGAAIRAVLHVWRGQEGRHGTGQV